MGPIIFSVRFQAKKKCHTIRTVPPSNRKIFERGTLDTPSTHKYCMLDWSLSWFVPDPRRGCGFPTSYVVVFLCSVGSVQYVFVLLILVELLTFLLFKLFNINPNNQIKHLTLLLVQWGAVVAVIVWRLDLQLPMQSVPIATDVVRSNLDHGEVCNMMR
jgi:hypothetical protein